MLYEPPKTKKYILIGAIAVALAVLAIIVIPLLYKNKTIQTPTANLPSQTKLQQQKIQKDMQEAAKRLKDQAISEQQTKDDMKSASEELKKLPAPSQDDMRKVAKQLNQLIK